MIGEIVGGLGAVGAAGINALAAAKQREWQSEENQKDRDYQSSEWTRQFNMTNEYNDPSKQVQRLAAAGISPAAALGGPSGAVGQSSASPSTPAGAHTSVMSSWSPGSDIANIFETFGRALSAYEKLPADAKQDEYVSGMIRKLSMESDNQMWQAKLNQYQSELLSKFGSRAEESKIQNVVQNTALAKANADKSLAEKDYFGALEAVSWAEKYLTEEKVFKTSAERRLLDMDLKFYRAKVQSEINKNAAISYNQYMQGKGQDFLNKINDAKKSQLDIIAQSEIDRLTSESKTSTENARMAKWLADKAEKETDLYTIRAYVEMIHMLVGDAIDGAAQFTRLGMLKELSETKKAEIDAKQKELYGKKIEFTRDRKIMDSKTGEPFIQHEKRSWFE